MKSAKTATSLCVMWYCVRLAKREQRCTEVGAIHDSLLLLHLSIVTHPQLSPSTLHLYLSDDYVAMMRESDLRNVCTSFCCQGRASVSVSLSSSASFLVFFLLLAVTG